MKMPKDWYPTLVVVGKAGEHELAFQLNPLVDLVAKGLRLNVDILRNALWDMEHNGVTVHTEIDTKQLIIPPETKPS